MSQLLNLFAAIALLVWGTHMVRSAILKAFGINLRAILARSIGNRMTAALAGLGVTVVVQSSTATAMIVSAFVGQGLLGLPLALAAMLGADVGTSLMALVLSVDLSWLSPVLILTGVILFFARQDNAVGRLGKAFVGLGLMLLALRLVTASTVTLTQAPAVRGLLIALQDDVLHAVVLGAVLTITAYSSLAVVLLTATLAASGAVPLAAALGLILGANLGSGLLAVITTAKSAVQVRHVPLGNLVFKACGVALALPLVALVASSLEEFRGNRAMVVVTCHFAFNLLVAIVFMGLTRYIAALVERWLPQAAAQPLSERRTHLDASALSTPSLALSCAAREAVHQADVVESMLRGVLTALKNNDLVLAQQLRQMDDKVDALYSSIKYYLTKLSRESLSEEEERRWTEIISLTINLEQIADTVERVLLDIEKKSISKNQQFSEAGMAEICDLHTHLTSNMRLAMSVFLGGNVCDAGRLLEEKARFRELERAYADSHLTRLADNTLASVQTSSLHLDLISEFRRINSHICAIGYPLMEANVVSRPHRAGLGVTATE
jgi:phosphate:Na+ symporter